jgi:hypothetical protein
MLKRILIAALMLPLIALAQSYPSPTFNNVTVQGTFTASGKVGLASLAPQAANTVVANATGSSASPTAVSVPNCAGTSSALTYTAGSGFSCNATINALTLGGATFSAPGPIGSTSTSSGAFSSISTPSATIGGGTINATTIGATSASSGAFTTLSATEPSNGLNTLQVTNTGSQGANIHMTGNGSTTPTKYLRVVNGSFGIANDANSALALALTDAGNLSVLGSIQPSQTGGIIGTNTTNNANAGSVGEYVTASGSSVALTSGSAVNIASISLTAGDWDVWGNVQFVPAGSTQMSQWLASINTTSATNAVPPFLAVQTFTTGAGLTQSLIAPTQRISVSSTTTVFLVGTSTFSTSTCAANGYISARRRR